MVASTSRRTWIAALALVSVAVVLGAPFVLLGVALLDHAVSFHGVCGPYAPDIPEHACDFETYLTHFFSPFAVMGMVVLAPMVMIIAALVVLFAWALGLLVAWARGRLAAQR